MQHYLNIMQHAPYCILPKGVEGKAIISNPVLFNTVLEATHWLANQKHPYHHVICDNLGNPL